MLCFVWGDYGEVLVVVVVFCGLVRCVMLFVMWVLCMCNVGWVLLVLLVFWVKVVFVWCSWIMFRLCMVLVLCGVSVSMCR